ncbi:MAG: hypothetical protein V7642_1956 [Burkholderiales bacterium]
MRDLFTTRSLSIAAGHAVSGTAKEAQTLRVLSGRLWITVEGLSHDYWLFAGDTFTLTPGVMTVMEADGAAGTVELANAGKATGWRGFGAQLRRLALVGQRFVRNRNAAAALSQGTAGPCETC